VSPPGKRDAPGGESEGAQGVTPTASTVSYASVRLRFNLARVLDRRHASLELDKMLDACRYPDPHELYGMTAALARMLEAEAS
jgi:hypothetical protein